MTTRKSYVGVTGFTDPSQLKAIAEISAEFTQFGRQVMTGVLTSSKTLRGLTNKYPNRYPHSDDPGMLHGEIDEIFELYAGDAAYALQINNCWPDTEELEDFRRNYDYIHVLLQVGSEAIEQAGGSPTEIALLVRAYGKLIDGVLFDPSGGKGKVFDPQFAAAVVVALNDAVPYLAIRGVAGGLDADNVISQIGPLLELDPLLSWDAEGRLRDADDHLDLGKVEKYLRASLEVLGANSEHGRRPIIKHRSSQCAEDCGEVGCGTTVYNCDHVDALSEVAMIETENRIMASQENTSERTRLERAVINKAKSAVKNNGVGLFEEIDLRNAVNALLAFEAKGEMSKV
jgi:hypothetical protein